MNRKILDITIMLVIKLLDWNYFIFKMPGLRFLILEQFYINFQDKNIYIYIYKCLLCKHKIIIDKFINLLYNNIQ